MEHTPGVAFGRCQRWPCSPLAKHRFGGNSASQVRWIICPVQTNFMQHCHSHCESTQAELFLFRWKCVVEKQDFFLDAYVDKKKRIKENRRRPEIVNLTRSLGLLTEVYWNSQALFSQLVIPLCDSNILLFLLWQTLKKVMEAFPKSQFITQINRVRTSLTVAE